MLASEDIENRHRAYEEGSPVDHDPGWYRKAMQEMQRDLICSCVHSYTFCHLKRC